MLTLLLDEHISPEVVEGLRRRNRNIFVYSLGEWEGGRLLGLSDELILKEASTHALTLVTYDRKTIPPLLKLWAETGREHGGVIFVDQKTIPSSDFGGLIRALQKLWEDTHKSNWKNQILNIRR